MWRRRLYPFGLAVLLTAPSLLAGAQTAQDRLTGNLDLFKRETDPVRRAKVFPRLGGAQIDEMQRLADAGDFVRSGALLEEYRDEVKSTFDALKATGVDAERKPGGFKELEIHLRKALKQIDDLVRRVPDGPRVPFQVARQDVIKVNRELIDLLFPRQPDKKPGKDKPKW
jgi:hypothetical protein